MNTVLKYLSLLWIVGAKAQLTPVNLTTLQLVQVLYRHGERVPEYPYPTDPNYISTEPKEGWAQLTDVSSVASLVFFSLITRNTENVSIEGRKKAGIYAWTISESQISKLCLGKFRPKRVACFVVW